MSSKTTIDDLPAEILTQIFKNLAGTGTHDIDPGIFEAMKINELCKIVIFEVLFSIDLNEGLSLGFEHYLECRVHELRKLCEAAARDYSKIENDKKQKLVEMEADYIKLLAGVPLDLDSPWRVVPRRQSAKYYNTYWKRQINATKRIYKIKVDDFQVGCRVIRTSFNQETQRMFAYQNTWNGKRKLVRGVGRGDWVWAEIVAARIESERQLTVRTTCAWR